MSDNRVRYGLLDVMIDAARYCGLTIRHDRVAGRRQPTVHAYLGDQFVATLSVTGLSVPTVEIKVQAGEVAKMVSCIGATGCIVLLRTGDKIEYINVFA